MLMRGHVPSSSSSSSFVSLSLLTFVTEGSGGREGKSRYCITLYSWYLDLAFWLI